ncbi:XRE family transcriptional regulator [Paenibacillus psychroresistens]|uniref:XRE family transcriptional regulator n=1 Tax=Paenibacillus psychroresistens TaxID=1778678 RepID=A0A6B8RKM9_9BACL|nr:helix-turn-helix transcriptional regulator [Paenibacillus psychroresistens]QGQ96115.1 XRE family transcriptional regulator [Paenibacillus psychroresistens]
MRIFSTKLKELRLGKKLSQEELSKKLDIPRTTIAGYESGARSLPREARLKQIAQFFNVSVDYLIGYSDEENNTEDLQAQIISIIRSADLHFNNQYIFSNDEKEKIIAILLNLTNLPIIERKIVLGMLEKMAKST